MRDEDQPDIPGVTERGYYLRRYVWGKPTPAKLRDMLAEKARAVTPPVTDTEAFSRFRMSPLPGCVWHMRAAADIIDDMQREIIRLGGT